MDSIRYRPIILLLIITRVLKFTHLFPSPKQRAPFLRNRKIQHSQNTPNRVTMVSHIHLSISKFYIKYCSTSINRPHCVIAHVHVLQLRTPNSWQLRSLLKTHASSLMKCKCAKINFYFWCSLLTSDETGDVFGKQLSTCKQIQNQK